MFPIGFIGNYYMDTPVVQNGSVIGFHVVWPGRKYPLDMAQFAVKVKTLVEVRSFFDLHSPITQF